MRIAGILFLLSGWLIGMAAAMLLKPGSGGVIGFVVAGLCVEAVGLVYFVRSQQSAATERRK
jgi:hypothetical protein